MKITILSVGKIKEKFFTEAMKEYTKRLSKYCKLTEAVVTDEKADTNFSPAQIERVKLIEGQKILNKIPKNSYVIVLDINGVELNSEEFAKKLNTLGIEGVSDITFVIGGSNGLWKEVINSSDFKLSFSKMTFPHQLFKVILLEQIYRAFKINSGETYHK